MIPVKETLSVLIRDPVKTHALKEPFLKNRKTHFSTIDEDSINLLYGGKLEPNMTLDEVRRSLYASSLKQNRNQ
jgi:hypothetical protein